MSQLLLPVNPKRDHIRGNLRAAVTLVEYGDFECPHCGRAYWVLKELEQDLREVFKLVFRHFPLYVIHPHALHASFATEAAALQGKFWGMHDMILEHQDDLTDPDLVAYAQLLGLDLDQFASDMVSTPVMDRVEEDIESGLASGVHATPTFFINDNLFAEVYDYNTLRNAIVQAEKEVNGPGKHRRTV
jgi:protein-disulfide isomerase